MGALTTMSKTMSRLYYFGLVPHQSSKIKACSFSVVAKEKKKRGNTPRKKSEIDRLRCDRDIIGPPDDLTNLRPIKFFIPPVETELEKKFRVEQEKVQDWNNEFWKEHNSSFIKESKAFQKERLKSCTDEGKKTLNAEEMSEFYKAYLDKNWNRHVSYNFEWYRKNAYLVYLASKVKISKLRNFFRKESDR